MGQECIARLFQAPIFLKKSTEPLDNDVVLLSEFLFSSNKDIWDLLGYFV